MNLPKSLGKWTTVIVVLVAIGLVGGGMMLSPAFTLTRSVHVNAPPEEVYAFVADPRDWKRWSVWSQRDPSMTITYSGPQSGTGAGWSWQSRIEGDGTMTVTSVEPGRRVAFELRIASLGARSKGEMRFTPEGDGTRVSWTIDGNMGTNPLYHWLAYFADPMMGPDFEGGLANLKAVAEKN
jgi:uncharacterized protein YndB with AHSA1/START domain